MILCSDMEPECQSFQELRASSNDVVAVVHCLPFGAGSFDVLPLYCCSVGIHSSGAVGNDSSVVVEVVVAPAHQVELC